MEGVEGCHVASVVAQQTKNSNYPHLLTHYQRKHKLLIKAAIGRKVLQLTHSWIGRMVAMGESLKLHQQVIHRFKTKEKTGLN